MATRYAEIADARRLGLGARAFSDEDLNALIDNLDAASGEADGYLANQYKLPLTDWGQDLVAAVCKIAVYEFMSVRGLSPEPGSPDGNILKRAEQARAWLKMVGEGRITPVDIADSTPNVPGTTGFDPEVVSSEQRGWSDPSNDHCGGPFVARGR